MARRSVILPEVFFYSFSRKYFMIYIKLGNTNYFGVLSKSLFANYPIIRPIDQILAIKVSLNKPRINKVQLIHHSWAVINSKN
jgi:hypothetical protein